MEQALDPEKDGIFAQNDDSSDDEHHAGRKPISKNNFMQKDDGGKQTAWNFGAQITVDDGKKQAEQDPDQAATAEETEELGQVEGGEETVQEQVQRVLEQLGVDMEKEMAQQALSKGKDDPALTSLAKNTEAKMHYDKDDLIQFHELMLSKPLIRACSDLDYEHPTIIQRKVVPVILEGHDVMAHAVTGSGKTASYLLPMLQKYLRVRTS